MVTKNFLNNLLTSVIFFLGSFWLNYGLKMASGYIYRKVLLERVRAHLAEGPVVVWGPPGFGKTLLLKEIARSLDLPYVDEWRPERGAFDLTGEPAKALAGQILALPQRPRLVPAEALLLGPESLAFTRAEVVELARRLGRPDCADEAAARLDGWPLLTRRGLEAGSCDPVGEPLRGYIETFLDRLSPNAKDLLGYLLRPLPEAALRSSGFGAGLDELIRGGWVLLVEGRVTLLGALREYLLVSRGFPPYEKVSALLTAALELDPEAAFLAYLNYGVPEAGRAFEELAGRLLRAGEYDRVVYFWSELPEGARTALGAVRVAEAERSRGKLEEALALAKWAAGRSGATAPLALDVAGTVLIHMGRYREAVAAFERGLQDAATDLRYKMLAGMGAALIRDGNFRRAVAVLEEAAALAQAAGDVEVLAKVQHNLGIALHHSGRLRQAVRRYREALELKRGAGPLTRANTLLSLGEALRLLGLWQEAHQVLRRAREQAQASGDYRAGGYALLNLGDLYLESDWLEDAEACYRRAEDVLEPVSDRYGLGLLWLGNAVLARKRGAYAAAADALARAERDFAEGGSPLELALVWLERALLLPEEADSWLERAEAAAGEAGGEYHRQLARARRVRAGGLGAEAALEAAAWVLEEDVFPLALEPDLLPVWLLAAQHGRAGAALLERLALGYGAVRVHGFGAFRLLAGGELRLPTAKEGWLLLWLWLRPEHDPLELFADAKRPRKRLQLAVHHLRAGLGEEWVRSSPAGYSAAPLPGVWWDAALLRAAAAAAQQVGQSPALRSFVRHLYRGEFAPGGPFDAERARFERIFAELGGD